MTCPSCGSLSIEGADCCFSCGCLFETSVRRALRKGSLIADRYEITAPLGRGGMGMVYQAHDRVLEEIVAIKVLRSDMGQSVEMAKRFRSEIRLARRVTHRNVCRIHEYGVDGELHFISMELVEGVNLKRVLRDRKSLPPQEALGLAIQVCEGLGAIHEVGIVHRDLKSANLMLTPANTIKLMDFGIAKQTGTGAEGHTSATGTGQIIGTPEYMSPEQARGEKVDARSDIYALGIVIFELFTGDVPFRADTPIATILKQIGEPPPLRTLARPLPEPLIVVLEKSLQKAPQDRFSEVSGLAHILRSLMAQMDPGRIEAGPTAPPAGPSSGPNSTPVPSAPTAVPRTRLALPPARDATPIPHHAPLVAPRQRTPEPTALAGASRRHDRLVIGIGLGLVLLGVIAGSTLLVSLLVRPGINPKPSIKPTQQLVATSSSVPEPSPTARVEPGPNTEASHRVEPAPTSSGRPAAPTSPNLVRSAVSPSPGSSPSQPSESRPEPEAGRRVEPSPPAPAVTPSVPARGELQLSVVPWAEVFVDGESAGTTPFRPLSLSEGTHVIRFVHPDYHPFQRKVEIRAGQTARLQVDLSQEAFPRNPRN